MKKEELIGNLKAQKFSKKILSAFEGVNRSKFVLSKHKQEAYEDVALPIGAGATISQPYTITFMLALLDVKNNQKILEVGPGSGYVLALLSVLSPDGKIFGIEHISELANRSKKILEGKANISVICADGSKGLEKEAPFDRILVSAAAEEIPKKLIWQLKVGGILVIPVKNSIVQIKKQKTGNKVKEFPGFAFVPLVSEE